MENIKIYPVCVIGGGSSGTMAVLRVVLNNDECLFFSGNAKDKKKSRALWVKKIENMPAHFNYKRGIEEPNTETLQWILRSPLKDNLNYQKNVSVIKLEKEGDIFRITDSKNETHFAKYIILCTGVMDIQPEINGSIESVFDYANSQTIDYCLICDGHHVFQKKASVIGHNNSAGWIAIMLHERYSPDNLTIFTNGKKSEFQADTQRLIETYSIKVEESPITNIIGENKGQILKGFKLENGKTIDTDISFVSLGMMVYNDLAIQLGADLDERGFVKADETGQTSVSGLYVAGDLKANTKKQIYTAWDTAVNSANAINSKIRISKRPR
jgi:thioredoxin reductase (NADPH)